jgi:DNA polymerase III sliding clamp (beta) subunit (PCNA family)
MNTVIELPAAELKTALTGLGKVISKRTTLPVLEHLRVTRDKAGIVTMQATDLDATAVYQAEQPSPGEPCDFLVPYDPLNKLVKGGKEPVQLTVETKDKIQVRTCIGSSAMEQTLTTLPVDEYPPLPLVHGQSIPMDASFRDALRQALDCCSDDGSRHVIQHVCLDPRSRDGHYIAATDGRHLYAANSFSFEFKAPVLIPDRPFLRWNKFLENGSGQLTVQPATKKDMPWLKLQSGPWTLLAKTTDAEFPNWKQVVPATDSSLTLVKLDADAVTTLLAGLPKLPGGDEFNRPVRLVITDQRLVVQARAKDASDWVRLVIDSATVTGKPISIGLNRDYLLKALRFGLTTSEFTDDLSPVVFSAGGRRMVVMPLRPDSAPPAQSAPPPQSAEPPTAAPNPQPTNINPPVNEPTSPAQPQQTSPMPKEPQTQPTETQPATETSPVKAVIQHIEQIKETLKGVLKEFAEVMDGLKQLEKEKRASDKEMESVREKLREIQAVRI